MGTQQAHSPARSLNRAVTVTIDSPAAPLLKEAPMQKLNRQERSDLTAFGVIVMALLLLVGGWFLTPPATAAQEQTAAVVTISDEVATDSEDEPSGIRSLTVGELLRDAWTAHSTLPAAPQLPAPYTVVPEYVASYDGAVPAYPASAYYSVPSTEFPGVTHVFESTTAQNA